MSDRPRHFSMLREFTIADTITLGNAASGMTAILCCMAYVADGSRPALWTALALLPVAFILDALDGWVARKLSRGSRLGADLDSLADIVSFGVAPAVLAWTLGARGGWDCAILVAFVGCGISRLARFNVTAAELADASTGKVRYFEGTPIPTSLLLVAMLGVAFATGATGADLWGGEMTLGPWAWHPLTLSYLAIGSAMVSGTLHIPKP